MRQLIQATTKPADMPRNAKFLIIRGRKVEEVWFPHTMTPEEVKKVLVDRLEILPENRVIRG